MSDLLTYESDNPSILELLEHGIHFSQHLLKNFNIGKGELFPIIIQGEEPIVHILKWGIETPVSHSGPELTYIYAPTIEKQESLSHLIKHQRVLIPVQKFVHRRSENGKDVIITHPRKKVLWMAGLWSESSDGQKGFALITCDTDPSSRTKIRRIPVFINDKTNIDRWIDRGTTTMSDLAQIISYQSVPRIQTSSLPTNRIVG